jgi:outer membrane protein OmpA-like peptidoglycan-associated protein
MKKPVLSFIILGAFVFSQPIFSQEEISPNAASAKVLFLDHGVVNNIDSLDVTNGLELAYIRSLSDWARLAIPLKISVADIAGELNRRTLFGLDAVVQIPFLKNLKPIRPYIFGGAGFLIENFEESNVQLPVGLGLDIYLGGNSFINFQAEYRKATKERRDNLQFGLGYLFYLYLNQGEDLPSDRDGDGISDETDKCPDEPGSITAEGCPDQDGDGVADTNDQCPDMAGTAKANGCPDQDDDGIADKFDLCPEVAGTIANKGCPQADRDGDGIIDEKDQCPEQPGSLETEGCPDSDGDGVADKFDLCQGEIGKKYTSGCPDKDLDGIADKFDDCPDLAGPPERRGCPLRDADNDGVADSQDECPNLAGPMNTNGCPDTDGDGLHDGFDKCPNVPGDLKNSGCPEIGKEIRDILALATSNVQFETGKAELLSSSYTVLNQIVDILNKYPGYKLRISGHTDNVGDDAKNQKLSEDRAKTCFDFIVGKGIPATRMMSAGFGETKPIASNTSAEGRALNRRVEFELYLE